MSLVINTNLASINGQVNLSSSQNALSTAMQRLSSGLRINSAKDDAAGLAIADRMTSQVNGMTVAVRNANDGISLTQTADSALGSLTDTLQTMRDLAVQASSTAGVSETDRTKLNTEFNALNSELTRIVANTQFNGKNILAGDLAGGVNVQVGATTDSNSQIQVAVSNMQQLLNPVSSATLDPASLPVDATLSTTVSTAALNAKSDVNLAGSNSAAKLANAAVLAAKAAAASPTDMALAKAASAANLAAATAIANSSATTLATTTTNFGLGLVSQAFSNTVTAASNTNATALTAITASDSTLQAASVTDSSQASALLTTAQQLAAAATADVSSSGQNVYASQMFQLTGDTLNQKADAVAADGTLTNTASVVNQAVNRGVQSGNAFNADRQAQITLAGLQIAKAVATASYVNDPNATAAQNQTALTSFVNSNSLVTGLTTSADTVGQSYSLGAINKIDAAIASVDNERSNLGSAQNRFTDTISNLQSGIENQSAAKSRITDADYAKETANLSRAQILQQAGTAMLAQANQSGQSVMTLLR
jgi:flagellin